jgi:ribulose-phosphate 3-epimerase
MPKRDVIIAPSILSADFARLGDAVREAEEGGADWIHVDVMDGHFVPNLTIGAPVVAALRKVTKLPLDVHLMIERPELLVADFAKAGSDRITVHVEASVHLHRLVQQIKELGAVAGVSLNPATPVGMLEEIVPHVDQVLVMSVNPGFGGQEFIPGSVEKIEAVAGLLAEYGSDALIAVDGGITPETAPGVVAAGARMLVAGAAVFGKTSVKKAIAGLRAAAASAT